MCDPLLPSLYHLSYAEYSELLRKHREFKESSGCVVQSFSSALPPVFLFRGLINEKNKGKKFDVMDACSAPGNKTLQLGEYVGKSGTVYAFEKDERRYHTLQKNIQKHQANNVQTILDSFLNASPADPMFKKVKLILLDPSCSGSGMLTNFTRDGCEEEDYSNLSFQ